MCDVYVRAVVLLREHIMSYVRIELDPDPYDLTNVPFPVPFDCVYSFRAIRYTGICSARRYIDIHIQIPLSRP